jgi:hypothetical protein
MRNADGGLAERDWEIFSRDGENDPETKIAHMSIDDQSQLDFQWQAEAKTLPLSEHLRNCAFSFNCGGQSHVVALREAARVEGWVLDLKKPSTKEEWTIDSVPDPAGIKIEIVGIQGSKFKVVPPTIEAKEGEAWIEIEEGGGLLSLKVETEMKRRVELSVTPHVKFSAGPVPLLSAGGVPQRCSAKQFETAMHATQANLHNTEITIKRLPQAINQAQGPLKNGLQQQLDRLQQTTQPALVAALAEGQKLANFLQPVGGNLEIQFRVLYDADSIEVELLHVGGGVGEAESQE